MNELLIRLSDQYLSVDENRSHLIVKWLDIHWEHKNEELLDLWLTILANLAPKISINFIKKKLHSASTNEKVLFLDLIQELE